MQHANTTIAETLTVIDVPVKQRNWQRNMPKTHLVDLRRVSSSLQVTFSDQTTEHVFTNVINLSLPIKPQNMYLQT